MCVIVVQPAGTELSGNKFRNCWQRNQDGGGYSFIHDEKLVIKKGYFEGVSMLDAYREDRAANLASPFLIHFRISTSGVIDEVNSHPHRVRDDLVMAHNGHIIGYGDKEQSDTLEFVALVLKYMPPAWEDDNIQLHLIERYISGDKMAMLREDGEYYIINEEAGTWKDGLWFSNNSYEKRKVYKTGYTPPLAPLYKGVEGAGGIFPANYVACGWDSNDTCLDEWGGEGEYDTYFDESCAYCDHKLDAEDAEFCINLEAWYPVCMDCIIENEDELVKLGVVCDAVTDVWDEMMDELEKKELKATVTEKKGKKDAAPATSHLWALTSNVFSS